jgi:very-short-patch-repair endonuclease
MRVDVFQLRDSIIEDYSKFIDGFLSIRDERIRSAVSKALEEGIFWPEPWISLNPKFTSGGTIDELVASGDLHPGCGAIFKMGKGEGQSGTALSLYQHQVEAIRTARAGHSYVLTTGTGSGKSLTYIIPIVDDVLRRPGSKSIKAIVVYPMNALANSQEEELAKFLKAGFPDGNGPVTFAVYTGQENDEERQRIMADPPDILLTNYVMLELILTRSTERPLIAQAQDLRFLVLDELHTYRGRQGADVALLCRRTKEACRATALRVVGTSATLATEGTFAEQQAVIADVATSLFGVTIAPGDVIGESLQRTTTTAIPSADALRSSVESSSTYGRDDYAAFASDPLAQWVESTIGIAERDGRLVRADPRTLGAADGLAAQLAGECGLSVEMVTIALRSILLAGSRVLDPTTGRTVFAFKLHQFVSRGSNVFATIEDPEVRDVTLSEQQYAPGDRSKRLFPLAFCRDGGQEYYVVERVRDESGDYLIGRDLGDLDSAGSQRKLRFLYVSTTKPWPDDEHGQFERLPADFLEEGPGGALRVRSSDKNKCPEPVWVTTDGYLHDSSVEGSVPGWLVPAPFRFCLWSGASYAPMTRSDILKLSTLGFEGRSTATTMLTIGALRFLEAHGEGLPVKLLNFTDNRQDAALQAGHFNDFVQVSLIRAALYEALADAAEEGLDYLTLPKAVQTALSLAPTEYSQNPDAKFNAKEEIDKALRAVLAYRLYVDLRSGWRVTAPNLEQCGLLDIGYSQLDELCEAGDEWAECHEALAAATPKCRKEVTEAVLDHLRRELAVKAEQLDKDYHESLWSRSYQSLIAPWALDESERRSLEQSRVAFLRSRDHRDEFNWICLTPNTLVGSHLRRRAFDRVLTTAEVEQVLQDLFRVLSLAGLIQPVVEHRRDDKVDVGYQIPAAALRWRQGDGKEAVIDAIRVPSTGGVARSVSDFFVEFYRNIAETLVGFEAREHTAQVKSDVREERERRFRNNELPVLFCSPTMELGIDIASLNIVGMRNVPPTPANYAQRSGRAGRSGQPALVIAYCSTGSMHDQYFFRHPTLMVSGKVQPPRLELLNEDLVRAHLHAIWLSISNIKMGRSLDSVLDVSGSHASLAVNPDCLTDLEAAGPRAAAAERASKVLSTVPGIESADWWHEGWIAENLNQITASFESACRRWRDLYRAAEGQQRTQNSIIMDHSKSAVDKDRAKRLRAEAEAQLHLLLNEETTDFQSDFYSYRYFASEGFLPGYNFPRLPLSAYIPGRQGKHDDYLNRPRFVAVREFGPRALIYHEGSVYQVTSVMIPVAEDVNPVTEDPVITTTMIQCSVCGYLHVATAPDRCERCEADLSLSGDRLSSMFRMTSVSTRRADRITANVEERQRQRYEIHTAYHFAEVNGQPAVRTARAVDGGGDVAQLAFGPTATLALINVGLSRRKDKAELGYLLDLDKGRWMPRPEEKETDDEPASTRHKRVIPFVEDRRNILIVDPGTAGGGPTKLSPEADQAESGAATSGALSEVALMASLEAVLKASIESEFDLEDRELDVESLPSREKRTSILLYEAAEGGAGVLRQLVDDPTALARVARAGLARCHFDPDTLEDLHRAPGATEDCTAACYDCLLSYTNQPDHRILDRFLVRDYLSRLVAASVETSPGAESRSEHIERLSRQAGSDLEREWLNQVAGAGYRLPDKAQVFVEGAGSRPDFVYSGAHTAIYVDGPHHEYPHRAARDADAEDRLFSIGWSVIRFGLHDDWLKLLAENGGVFGNATP